MGKYRLYVIRKQGNQYQHLSVGFCRDTVTGEYSVSLSGFGWLFMVCLEKAIPELISLARPRNQFPRQMPCDILAGKDFVQK